MVLAVVQASKNRQLCPWLHILLQSASLSCCYLCCVRQAQLGAGMMPSLLLHPCFHILQPGSLTTIHVSDRLMSEFGLRGNHNPFGTSLLSPLDFRGLLYSTGMWVGYLVGLLM